MTRFEEIKARVAAATPVVTRLAPPSLILTTPAGQMDVGYARHATARCQRANRAGV
jgi:hypothetical protein